MGAFVVDDVRSFALSACLYRIRKTAEHNEKHSDKFIGNII